MSQIHKHDKYVDELCEKVKVHYDLCYTNLPMFSEKKRLIGEIDLIGVCGEYIDVYEVKCSHRPTKAKKQLKKIRKILSKINEFKHIRTFFYCGESSRLEMIAS